jgi:calcineurin-like phosphoesterase
MFGNLFKSGSLRVEAIGNCGTGIAKTFALNGTTVLTKTNQEFELEEIEEAKTEIIKFEVYPNPNQGNFTLNLVSNEKGASAKVTIINMMGQVVSEFNVENNNGVVQTNINQSLPEGLYFVRVSIGSELKTVKILVTK